MGLADPVGPHSRAFDVAALLVWQFWLQRARLYFDPLQQLWVLHLPTADPRAQVSALGDCLGGTLGVQPYQRRRRVSLIWHR